MNSLRLVLKGLIIFPLSCLLLSCSNKGDSDFLKERFINPPDSARPGVYWYFMDGNIEREAITSDLESMKEAGIGYVLFLEVNVGVPRGKVDFLSEEWQVNITGMVRNQNNHLEIEVANLWINRLIGDEAELWDGIKDGKWPEWLLNGTIRPSERYTFTTHRYYRKGDTLSESGLMGPVTIETLQ